MATIKLTNNTDFTNAARGLIEGAAIRSEEIVEPAGTTALIGQIPLEGLDLVVDPKSREVTVNPASPDRPLMDLYSAVALIC